VKRLGLAVAIVASLIAPRAAHAFCGFYVAGSGEPLYNNATQVTLMRQGTRTVLSMQNNYQGPPQDFALVIPVPVVLQKEQVQTLRADVFGKVDVMGSPRLVEYWEQDPCAEDVYSGEPMKMAMGAGMAMEDDAPSAGRDYGVKIEAKFTVGEYQILILSATESTGLDRWLRASHYQIPDGAEPLLRPYVEAGSKFFVAKVDPKKVAFVNGMATLSPLRFYYDADEFALPIRLGMANAKDKQDLIVNILAPDTRYELANYKNVTIPTNLDVKDAVRTRFAEFYAALFDRTLAQNPGAIVTEYSWDASSCDPCPGPTLDYDDFATLGADVLGNGGGAGDVGAYGGGFVLTRLHARYGKGDTVNDLVFKTAPAIVGGREQEGPSGRLEQGAQLDETNNFQGRYVIRHRWTGAIACEHPVRNRWGGPPGGEEIAAGPQAATNLAFAPRGQIALPEVVAQAVPELGITPGVALPPGPRAGGCGCATGDGGGGTASLGAIAVALCVRRRRRAA
jgi:MYXO-CTERM domain-containing protein